MVLNDSDDGYTTVFCCFFFSSRRRHTRLQGDWSSDVCSSDLGYEDCNDHDILRDDPVFKLIADRLPEDEALASQPTLSRFENLATADVLQKLDRKSVV